MLRLLLVLMLGIGISMFFSGCCPKKQPVEEPGIEQPVETPEEPETETETAEEPATETETPEAE